MLVPIISGLKSHLVIQYFTGNYVLIKRILLFFKIFTCMKKLDPTAWQKVLVVFICFAFAVYGFMIKLPSGFRHIDKELHALFYFLAAALLNILFAGTKLIWHAIIFITLYLFGAAIEYMQEYSNRFFRRRIHGRFDPEDIQWNLKGLIAFSLLWLLCTVVILVYKRATLKQDGYKSKAS
jgi:hypothetical protein